MNDLQVRVEEDDEIVVTPLFHMERIGLACFDLQVVGGRLRWMTANDVHVWTSEMIGLDRPPGRLKRFLRDFFSAPDWLPPGLR
jgi:hypothetical protein